MGWRFGWGNWMKNQGFFPKGKNEKEEKNNNMNTNQNVYDYYGHHFFNPWFRKFHKKEGETNDGKNEINNNQNASNTQQENNQMGYNNWQFDPWGIGYGDKDMGGIKMMEAFVMVIINLKIKLINKLHHKIRPLNRGKMKEVFMMQKLIFHFLKRL